MGGVVVPQLANIDGVLREAAALGDGEKKLRKVENRGEVRRCSGCSCFPTSLSLKDGNNMTVPSTLSYSQVLCRC